MLYFLPSYSYSSAQQGLAHQIIDPKGSEGSNKTKFCFKCQSSIKKQKNNHFQLGLHVNGQQEGQQGHYPNRRYYF